MTTSDGDAADFYAQPANQGVGRQVVSRRALSSSIPVRFPPEIVDEVRARADAEGITVSEWIRRTISDALAAEGRSNDPAAIVEELRRDVERLAARIA
jgi:hypothetical protein